MKNSRDEVSKAVGWAFVGFTEDGEVPIGVYTLYRDGAAVANAWMKSTPGALLWEGECIYEEYEDGK